MPRHRPTPHQLLLLLLAATCCIISCNAQPLEVVELADSTFEHQTQASTGQTTGHWCVLFTNSSAPSKQQEAASEAWEELAGDEDKAVIFAAVDATGSPKLAARFGLKRFPSVRLFRDRQMYAFPGPLATDAAAVHQQLLNFLHGGYQEVEGHAVPGEPSALSSLTDALQQLRAQAEQWGGAVTAVAGVLIFLGAALAGMVLKRQAASAGPATPYSSRPGSARTSSPGTSKPAGGKSGLANMKSALAAEFNDAVAAAADASEGKGKAQQSSGTGEKKDK